MYRCTQAVQAVQAQPASREAVEMAPFACTRTEGRVVSEYVVVYSVHGSPCMSAYGALPSTASRLPSGTDVFPKMRI